MMSDQEEDEEMNWIPTTPTALATSFVILRTTKMFDYKCTTNDSNTRVYDEHAHT